MNIAYTTFCVVLQIIGCWQPHHYNMVLVVRDFDFRCYFDDQHGLWVTVFSSLPGRQLHFGHSEPIKILLRFDWFRRQFSVPITLGIYLLPCSAHHNSIFKCITFLIKQHFGYWCSGNADEADYLIYCTRAIL